MPYYGNRTLTQQKTTELVVRHLFSNSSFMALLMRDSFEIASYDKIIPQYGTDSNYYSVLQYLFSGTKGGGARSYTTPGGPDPHLPKGVSIPGIPAVVAEYLAGMAHSARQAVENLG